MDVKYWVLRGSDRFYGEMNGGVGVLPCWFRDPLDRLVRKFKTDYEASAFAVSRGFAATPHLIEYTDNSRG